MSKKKTPSKKATQYALGVAEGKSKKQAALDAGYAPSTANRTNMIEKTESYQLSKHIIEEATAKAIETNREVQKRLSEEILKNESEAIKNLTPDQKLTHFEKLDNTFQQLTKRDEASRLQAPTAIQINIISPTGRKSSFATPPPTHQTEESEVSP